ncbi:MAG: thiamine phosphate synthase, partial [Oleispira antarctica]|nr:thiamine phosphate synthase [Oleispira antarctica]
MACHNLTELEVAQNIADYVLVSPVHETTTHPQANALTWSGFKVITDQARIPCYALGGVTMSESQTCIQFGGQGIAGIRCFMADEKKYNEEK